MNTRSQQNSVNDGKIQKVKFFAGIYCFNKFFTVYIILVQHVKWLKLFNYNINLPWLTLPPVLVHGQDRIATKIAYV